jgi:hypothetical protein
MKPTVRILSLYFGRKDQEQDLVFRELSRMSARVRYTTMMRWLLSGRASELRSQKRKRSSRQARRTPSQSQPPAGSSHSTTTDGQEHIDLLHGLPDMTRCATSPAVQGGEE